MPAGPGQRLQVPTAACASAPGCRLVGFALVENVSSALIAAAEGVKVTLHQVDQVGPDKTVLVAARLADRARWRATAGPLTANSPSPLPRSGARGQAPR